MSDLNFSSEKRRTDVLYNVVVIVDIKLVSRLPHFGKSRT